MGPRPVSKLPDHDTNNITDDICHRNTNNVTVNNANDDKHGNPAYTCIQMC